MSKYQSEIILPEGFSYPEKFLKEVVLNKFPHYQPWFFLSEMKNFESNFFDYALEDYPTRSLIPFARYDGTDDVACFDGNDHSGDPKIYIVHFFASAGWEDRGSYLNFESWLEAAKKESLKYKAMMEEDSD